jgi:hypothetical protein
MSAYWRRVFKRAWTDWLQLATGQPLATTLYALIFFAALTFLTWLEEGSSGLQLLRNTLIVAALLGVPTFLYKLARAPYLLDKENAEKAARLESELREEIAKQAKQLDDRAQRREVTEQLAQFLAEGRDLQARCFTAEPAEMKVVVNEWSGRVGNFLYERFGRVFVERFITDAGLPMSGVPNRMPHKTEGWYQVIGARMARLNQFIQELGRP